MIDVLFTTNTFSIAMVGTSAIRMRLNALAIAGDIPLISNSTFSWSSFVTSILNRSRKDSMENVLSTPTAAYAPENAYSFVCLFSSAPHVTNARCFSSSAFTDDMSGVLASVFFFEPAIVGGQQTTLDSMRLRKPPPSVSRRRFHEPVALGGCRRWPARSPKPLTK